jgi:predicted enzyme related to lactoylglutathione lyase
LNLLVNIDVDDLPRAIAFYSEAFDLGVGRRFGDGAVEMLGALVPIYLLAKPAGSQATGMADVTRCYRRHWTPVHLDIVVTDIEAAVRKALGAGATLERPTQLNSWGKLALMADPFGNGFCLVQFIGRGYDEIATQ